MSTRHPPNLRRKGRVFQIVGTAIAKLRELKCVWKRETDNKLESVKLLAHTLYIWDNYHRLLFITQINN